MHLGKCTFWRAIKATYPSIFFLLLDRNFQRTLYSCYSVISIIWEIDISEFLLLLENYTLSIKSNEHMWSLSFQYLFVYKTRMIIMYRSSVLAFNVRIMYISNLHSIINYHGLWWPHDSSIYINMIQSVQSLDI